MLGLSTAGSRPSNPPLDWWDVSSLHAFEEPARPQPSAMAPASMMQRVRSLPEPAAATLPDGSAMRDEGCQRGSAPQGERAYMQRSASAFPALPAALPATDLTDDLWVDL